MTAIRAVVRNGRIETEDPIELPEGTELLISLPNGVEDEDEVGWNNTPEGIAGWLNWYDTLQPLQITSAEEADAADWLKRCDQHAGEKVSKDIGNLFS